MNASRARWLVACVVALAAACAIGPKQEDPLRETPGGPHSDSDTGLDDDSGFTVGDTGLADGSTGSISDAAADTSTVADAPDGGQATDAPEADAPEADAPDAPDGDAGDAELSDVSDG